MTPSDLFTEREQQSEDNQSRMDQRARFGGTMATSVRPLHSVSLLFTSEQWDEMGDFWDEGREARVVEAVRVWKANQ